MNYEFSQADLFQKQFSGIVRHICDVLVSMLLCFFMLYHVSLSLHPNINQVLAARDTLSNGSGKAFNAPVSLRSLSSKR